MLFPLNHFRTIITYFKSGFVLYFIFVAEAELVAMAKY